MSHTDLELGSTLHYKCVFEVTLVILTELQWCKRGENQARDLSNRIYLDGMQTFFCTWKTILWHLPNVSVWLIYSIGKPGNF